MMKKQIQKLNKGEAVTGYLFILPQMIGLMIFVIIPLVMIIAYSFQNRNFLFGNLGFCGLENYRMLIDDEIFHLLIQVYRFYHLEGIGCIQYALYHAHDDDSHKDADDSQFDPEKVESQDCKHRHTDTCRQRKALMKSSICHNFDLLPYIIVVFTTF